MNSGLANLNVSLLGHHDLDGHGDGGQVQVSRRGDRYYAFIGHMKGMGTTILDVTDVADSRIVSRVPVHRNTHSHKVRVCGDTMLVNAEQLGSDVPFEAGLRLRHLGHQRPQGDIVLQDRR